MKDKILDSFADLNVSVNGYDAALKVSNKNSRTLWKDKCIIVFNKFKSAIFRSYPTTIIPLDVSNSSKEEI